MTPLVTDVLSALNTAAIPTALIGAAALALRGVPRSSADTDLLVIGTSALEALPWAALAQVPTNVEIRAGEAGDPLAGVVRIVRAAEQVDVVALRGAPWQREVLADATPMRFGSGEVRVCTASGLVLLKLYAGGYHDRQDVLALLALHGADLRAEVDGRIAGLTSDAIELWDELREAR